VQEELDRAFPLLRGEQEPFARRPESEDSVQPAARQELEVRVEGVLVEARAAVAKRRQRCGEGSAEHDAEFRLGRMAGLRIERDGFVLRVTLAKPERRNAFDAAVIAELTEAFSDVGDARVVVLAGDGPSFCAGADVEWQRASIDLSLEENVEDALRLYRMLDAIDSCPAPVVARIHGYALGGGSGVAAATDIAVAREDAVFGFSEVKLGIIPAVISPFVFARIGAANARRYFLTGERFDAHAALRIGLVHDVVADPDEAVEQIVGEILTSGPEAVRAAKRLARTPVQSGEELAQLAARMRTSAEGQEGLRAFLEKREAEWRR
jgi:enoyl-CoA hydratase/carnithine racemase